jgi:hypothetical protein
MMPISSRRKKLAEPDFKNPPLWIHGVLAGILVRSKREAKRRELLRLLDQLPAEAATRQPSGRPSATRR